MFKPFPQILTSLLLLLLAWQPTAFAATADPGKAAPTAHPVKEFYVQEEIFNSRMFMLQTGEEHEQTVILVHGLGDTAAQIWDKLIPRLAEKYHVIAFDLPGFGRSESRNTLYSPENYAQVVGWVAEHYAKPQHSVIGHSLGGSIALMYAAKKPATLQRLVLVDVAGILHRSAIMENFFQPTLDERVPRFPKRLSAAIDDLVGDASHLAGNIPVDTNFILHSALMRKTLLGGNPTRIAALALAETDFSPIIFRPVCPTLILWGENDATSPARIGYLLESSLPNARLQIIPGTGHLPMKHRAERFNAAVLNFLAAPSVAADKKPSQPATEKYLATGETNQVISGDFEVVELNNCKNMLLRNLRTRQLILRNSSANLEKVDIKSATRGLTLINAEVVVSGMVIEAPQAISMVNSRGDFAGVDIRGAEQPIISDAESYLLFSTSRIKGAKRIKYLHGRWANNQ